jgi:hypothetical protein
MSALYYKHYLTFARSNTTIGWCWEGGTAWVDWEGLVWCVVPDLPRQSYRYLVSLSTSNAVGRKSETGVYESPR